MLAGHLLKSCVQALPVSKDFRVRFSYPLSHSYPHIPTDTPTHTPVRHNFVTNILSSTTSTITGICYFWHNNQFKLHYCGIKSARSKVSACLLLHPLYLKVLFIAPHESCPSVCTSRTPNDSSSDNNSSFPSRRHQTLHSSMQMLAVIFDFYPLEATTNLTASAFRKSAHRTPRVCHAEQDCLSPSHGDVRIHTTVKFAVKFCNGHLSTIILLLLGLTNTTST